MQYWKRDKQAFRQSPSLRLCVIAMNSCDVIIPGNKANSWMPRPSVQQRDRQTQTSRQTRSQNSNMDPNTTILRVKRKRGTDPADALLLACKRIRPETTQSPGETVPEPEAEVENSVFKLVATVTTQVRWHGARLTQRCGLKSTQLEKLTTGNGRWRYPRVLIWP